MLERTLRKNKIVIKEEYRIKLLNKFIPFLLGIATFTLLLFSSHTIETLSAELYWQQQLASAEKNVQTQTDPSLFQLYHKAVSKANLGQLIDTYELVEKHQNDFEAEKLRSELQPYLDKVKNGSNNPLYLSYAAFFYSITEDYNKALQHFKNLSQVQPENIWAYNYRAALLIEEKENYELAVSVLEQSLNIEENDITRLLIAWAHFQKNNYLQAMNNLRRGRGAIGELRKII